jgi:hypothetical protein
MSETTRNEQGLFITPPKSPGRPRGPSPSDQVRKLLEPHREALINKAVAMALEGDPQQMRLCLERLAPAPKQEAEKVIVPGLASAPTLQGKSIAILAAVAEGQISAEAGDKLLRMLESFGKAVVLDEHDKRMRLVEGEELPPQLLPEYPCDLV